jgi:integrase
MRERRFLTRAELGQLLDEVPRKWRPLLELLAATGLRISEAIGLRWSDLALDSSSSHLQVRRAVVRRVVVAHTLRHTCASMLIKGGLSPLRLQRWMGHHSAAFTLEVYGHLLDGDLGPPLDIRREPEERREVHGIP